jgi:hypothetical protein
MICACISRAAITAAAIIGHAREDGALRVVS